MFRVWFMLFDSFVRKFSRFSSYDSKVSRSLIDLRTGNFVFVYIYRVGRLKYRKKELVRPNAVQIAAITSIEVAVLMFLEDLKDRKESLNLKKFAFSQ